MQVTEEKIVLDLETKKGFDEVGRQNLQLLGVSVVGIYSYKHDEFKVFLENELDKLISYLKEAKLVVGFNIKGFDYPVLQPYLNFDLSKLPTLDILEEIRNTLGFRLSLDSVAKASLDIGKSGSGLDALKYFREGNIKKLSEYCQRDVFVTREVYEYGRKNSHLLYRKGAGLETISASWGEGKSINKLLQEAFGERQGLEIEYSSPNNNNGQKHLRRIDIYAFDMGRIIAYCHLRSGLRTFNVRRILSAKLTENKYEIPASFNLQKFKAQQKYF